MTSTATRALVVAVTGASGAIYAWRLLEALRDAQVQTHLVISESAALTLYQELDVKRGELEALASQVHGIKAMGAVIASGSAAIDGMVVAPCSMHTLAAIAHGLSDNLIARAADVTLKERRRLVLLTRETPLNLAHLRNMVAVTEMGGIIFPPVPAFYQRPQSIEQMVTHTIARVLDLFALQHALAPSWPGLGASAT